MRCAHGNWYKPYTLIEIYTHIQSNRYRSQNHIIILKFDLVAWQLAYRCIKAILWRMYNEVTMFSLAKNQMSVSGLRLLLADGTY